MRQIRVGKDGIVPILDVRKLYVMEVYFSTVENLFSSTPKYYVCVTDVDGTVSFKENSVRRHDSGFYSHSIQECVKKVLTGDHLNFVSTIYEFDNISEFEKEKGIQILLDIVNKK